MVSVPNQVHIGLEPNFTSTTPASDWQTCGSCSKKDTRDDDNGQSDDEDLQEYTLFVRASRPQLEPEIIELLAARMALDSGHNASVADLTYNIQHLIEGTDALQCWGRLACGECGDHIQAKSTESEFFHQQGHDASNVKVCAVFTSLFTLSLLRNLAPSSGNPLLVPLQTLSKPGK